MSKPIEHTAPTPVPAPNSCTKKLRADQLDILMNEKSRVTRRMKMKLGDRYTDGVLADIVFSQRETLSKWRNKDSREAPTLVTLLAAPDDVCDELLAGLAAARERLGHPARRWAAVEESDHTIALEKALSRAAAANAELLALVTEMRGNRR